MPTVFFPVSRTKFVVMSIVTFGLYDLYWSYKNWSYLKKQDGLKISPFWRAWFVLFFHYSLLQRMKNRLGHRTSATYNSAPLTVAYFALLLSARLPDPLSLLSMLSFIPVLPVVLAVEAANASVPADLLNTRFSGWNVTAIVVFLVLLALAVTGYLLPSS